MLHSGTFFVILMRVGSGSIVRTGQLQWGFPDLTELQAAEVRRVRKLLTDSGHYLLPCE